MSNAFGIKVGDTVKLKSSPQGTVFMNVSAVDEIKGMATCNWLDKENKPQHEVYPLVILEYTDSPDEIRAKEQVEADRLNAEIREDG